jgi:hypothetical protein
MKAMRVEIGSINKNQTWTLIEKPNGVKPIGLKWVTINKHKARLVAKGYV